jgi:hypothetical protein
MEQTVLQYRHVNYAFILIILWNENWKTAKKSQSALFMVSAGHCYSLQWIFTQSRFDNKLLKVIKHKGGGGGFCH